MKLITVDDFLAWHNNAGGFLSYPVIVQLDNDPSNGRSWITILRMGES